jgi:hypothetical protein
MDSDSFWTSRSVADSARGTVLSPVLYQKMEAEPNFRNVLIYDFIIYKMDKSKRAICIITPHRQSPSVALVV